jgi:hypothetical protein
MPEYMLACVCVYLLVIVNPVFLFIPAMQHRVFVYFGYVLPVFHSEFCTPGDVLPALYSPVKNSRLLAPGFVHHQVWPRAFRIMSFIYVCLTFRGHICSGMHACK